MAVIKTLASLPDDVINEIFKHLQPSELVAVSERGVFKYESVCYGDSRAFRYTYEFFFNDGFQGDYRTRIKKIAADLRSLSSFERLIYISEHGYPLLLSDQTFTASEYYEALRRAVWKGHLSIVKALSFHIVGIYNDEYIQHRKYIDHLCTEAAAHGQLEIVKYLADCYPEEVVINIALSEAARCNKLAVVKYLVETFPLISDLQGALQVAKYPTKNVEIIEYLISKGAHAGGVGYF